MFEDKILKCKECGEQFIFSIGEQEFYAQKGFQNEPARCSPCRRARKQEGGVHFRQGQPLQPASPRPGYGRERH